MKIIKSIFILSAMVSLSALATNAYFSDQTKVEPNQFTTGFWNSVVINEVYYDVAPDKGNEGNTSNPDEWIELYNNTSFDISLKNWTIEDNNTSRTINANKSIPANGFVLISKSANTWSLYWGINPGSPPAGVEIIELGQKIGNGLGNDGDRLILRDADGNIIDQMNYGNDTAIWNPASPDVNEGHSLSRNPAGYDHDLATDFVDNCQPSPGADGVSCP